MTDRPVYKYVPTNSGKELALTVTQPDDPAYFLLKDGHTSTPVVYREDCYICRDPEFAQMGLTLCSECAACGGHVSADDIICDDCGANMQDLALAENIAKCKEEGHLPIVHDAHEINYLTPEGDIKARQLESYSSCSRCGVYL